MPTNPSREMTMHFTRRDFLKSGAATLTFASLMPGLARADVSFDPTPGTWRTFEVITRVEIAKAVGATQAWIPLPSVSEKDWIKPGGSRWIANGDAAVARDPHYGAQMLHVRWQSNLKVPTVEITNK